MCKVQFDPCQQRHVCDSSLRSNHLGTGFEARLHSLEQGLCLLCIGVAIQNEIQEAQGVAEGCIGGCQLAHDLLGRLLGEQ